MATTETDIANRALSRLGQTQITSIADTTVVPTYCRTHFASVRQQLLRSHPWNFAVRREALARFNDDPRFGPRHAFILPPSYLDAIQAWADIEGYCKIERYSIEEGFLLANTESAYLLYVEDILDPTYWDSTFTECAVLMLASRIAKQITGDASLAQALLSEVEQIWLPKAMLYNAREDTSTANSAISRFIGESDINRVHQYGLGFGYGLPQSFLDTSYLNTDFY